MTTDLERERVGRELAERTKPVMPDRLLRFWEFVYFCSDLACWKADRADRLLPREVR
jgi:hypothetical protein